MEKAFRLTEDIYHKALSLLAESDVDLARILTTLGPPPMWQREPGFPTLIQIILEQQVSLASARAAFDKLLATVSPLTPAGFLELDDPSLKLIGFSRQKTHYCRELAKTIQGGQFDLQALEYKEDEIAKSELMLIKGIGPWTAEIYLLMALGRPDAWPIGDLALVNAVQKIKKLPLPPSREIMNQIGATWQPWRAVAARLLWHSYLNPNPPLHLRNS